MGLHAIVYLSHQHVSIYFCESLIYELKKKKKSFDTPYLHPKGKILPENTHSPEYKMCKPQLTFIDAER